MSTLAVNNVTEVGGAPVVTSGVLDSGSLPTGTVLQVVSTTKTDAFSASIGGASFVAVTGLSATITPKSTSSKILVQVSVNGVISEGTYHIGLSYRLLRDSTPISIADAASLRAQVTGTSGSYFVEGNTPGASAYLNYLDSPSTTSAVVYSVEGFNQTSGTKTMYVNRSQSDADAAQRPRLTSTITLIEVAG